MAQTSETGRKGCENGYKRADEIGILLSAVRLSKKSNEFRWGDRIVVIKTGPSAVVTRASLGRVAAIVYGEKNDDDWFLYEISPIKFEGLSRPSRSARHSDNYRLVSGTRIREQGKKNSL